MCPDILNVVPQFMSYSSIIINDVIIAINDEFLSVEMFE